MELSSMSGKWLDTYEFVHVCCCHFDADALNDIKAVIAANFIVIREGQCT